ncbi:MAG TPA: ABC transporter permease subunit [Dictyoglomaceae bacterium]|nr:ABC transporter permease subunit [Dictyoglomaceae bacterium]HOL39466.1 ABC transporter permease subunit [Dictyoglomaceae bacterium]HPU43831.1 ABC transporter permease subunit [Dictyoglomaceae bacterium]
MVGRKRYIFTHIILWILIPIILFPIIWVVSTSIRRDEAAFSTKLFSSRLTLQNYKDLIAPEKNMPVLAQELQNLILRTPPYDTWEKEKLEGEISKDIQSLKSYLKETQDKYENAKNSFDHVNNTLFLKTDEIKERTLSILTELKSYLEKNLPTEGQNVEHLKIVLYKFLSNESYNSPMFLYLKEDLEKVLGYKVTSYSDYKKAISDLNKAYKNYFGNLEIKLSKLETEIAKNSMEYKMSWGRYEKLQEEILSINEKLNSEIKTEIAAVLDQVKTAGNIKDTKIITVSSQDLSNNSTLSKSIKTTRLLIEKLNRYPDLYELNDGLKEILSYLRNYGGSSQNNLVSLSVSIENLNGKISPLLTKLGKDISAIQEEERKLASLKQQNEFLEMQEELLQDEIEEQEEYLVPTTKLEYINIFIRELEEKINTIEDKVDLADIVSYCAPIEGEFRDFATSYILDFGRDNLVVKIENTADRLKWFNDYNTFLEKFNLFSKNLSSTLEKIGGLILDFDSKWESLLNASLNNEKVDITELDELYNIIKTDYLNLVSSNMNIVSKKTEDLTDSIPYEEVKRDLNHIDGELFRVDQIWKQKTKHYFLRWVRNSIVVAGVAAIITTLICSLAAYPFSRMRFWGRRYGILSLLLIQMFPSAVYMIAIYSLLNLLGKFIPALGLDTLSGLTFVYLGNIAYNMYLIKGYYDTIPDSLEESAMIDGATRFQTFYKIVVPLARPILTVVVILTFMNIFNEFIFARILLQDAKNYTYAVGLWTFSTGPYQTEWGLFTAAALLGMLPMTILFISLQKYIVSGLTQGAVKG